MYRDNGSFSPEHEGSIKSERDFSENDNQMAASLQVPPGPPSRNVGPRASATLPTVIFFSSLRLNCDNLKDLICVIR